LIWPATPESRQPGKSKRAKPVASNQMNCRRIAGFVAELYMKFGEQVPPALTEFMRSVPIDDSDAGPLFNGQPATGKAAARR
jgi:hypothetical protein